MLSASYMWAAREMSKGYRGSIELTTLRLRNHSRSAALSLSLFYRKIRTYHPFVFVYPTPSATQKSRTISPIERLHSFCARVFQGVRKWYIKLRLSLSICYSATIHVAPTASGVPDPLCIIVVCQSHSVCCCGESSTHALCARLSYIWLSCVAFISVCCFSAHSIYGFRTPPTMPIPSARKPSGSFALITLTGGNRGLSALTCAASLAACSMASISSLQAAWSKGHTTMGCRKRISRADDNLACGFC